MYCLREYVSAMKQAVMNLLFLYPPRSEQPAPHAATPQWHPYGVAEMGNVTPLPELPAHHTLLRNGE